MRPDQNFTQIPGSNIRRDQIALLKRLSDANGVSGNEGEVRALVLEQVRPLCDEVKVDVMGNVLAVRVGKEKSRLRVMVAAHMDEVGLMVTKDEGGGIFRFEAVGGVSAHMLVGKSVRIGKAHLAGVIGVKPIHLFVEAPKPATLDELRIDVSPDKGQLVNVGDWATFGTNFEQWGPSICGKALDDRIGVAMLIELLRNAPSNIDLLAAFTVQEEVGLRGAQVAAYSLNPDIALVLDCTPARDIPAFKQPTSEAQGFENHNYNTRLGEGAAIYIADGATISDPRLVRHLIQTAERNGIPFQLRQPGGGGTDAGAIHLQRGGIPSVSISVPGRYAHSGVMIARISDWSNTQALVFHALESLTPEILAADR